MADNIISILFGVAGGSSLDGESGALIKKQLESIAQKIKLKINIDRDYFSNQLKTLKAEIDKTLGNLKIDVSATGQKSKATTGSSSSAGSDTMNTQSQAAAYKDLYTQPNKVDTAFKKLDKERNERTNVYAALKSQAEATKTEFEVALQTAKEGKKVSEEQLQLLAARQSYLETERNSQANLTTALNNDKLLGGMQTTFNGLIAKVKALNERYADLIAHNKDAAIQIQKVNDLASIPYAGNARIDENGEEIAANYTEAAEQIKVLAQELKTTGGAMSDLSVQTDTFGTKLRKAFSSKVMNAFSYALIALITKAFKSVYDNVVKIDTAMTQLRIVTNQSATAYEKFADKAAAAAKKVGASIADIIDATTVFARLGYTLSDSTILGELATSYSKVGDVGIDDATANITAIIKAFNIAAKDVESVIDQLIWVGNNFAISSAEIGEGMNNAASALAANGNTLQEAIGILTAANVTVQNASKSSTAVRTIAARISGSVATLQELGEDTDILSASKLDEKMRAFGVAIVDANGELRSTYDILDDLALVWDRLNSVEQAAITDMLAGTRQQNAFYSIMQNWSDAENIVLNAANATGALQTAQEEYINSVEGRMNQLGASWEQFSTSFMNSEFIELIIRGLNGLATTLSFVTDNVDLFSTGISVLGGVVIAAVIKKFQAMALAANEAGKSISKSLTQFFKANWATVLLYSLTVVLGMLSKIEGTAGKTATTIISAITLVGVAIIAVLKSTNKAFLSTPITAIITVALAAVLALTDGIKGLINASKQAKESAIEAANESKSAWKSSADAVINANDELKKMADRIAELRVLTKSGTITLVEQQELEKLQQANDLLLSQMASLEAQAVIDEEKAHRDAVSAVNAINNERLNSMYVEEDTGFWAGLGRWAASYFTLGLSDALGGYGVSDYFESISTEEYIDAILGNWSDATEQQKEAVTTYFNALREQVSELTYYSGDSLTDWQKESNDTIDSVMFKLDKQTIAIGGFSSLWNNLLSRMKFEDSTEFLTAFADAGNYTAEALRNLYDTNADVKNFLDYLNQLGVFSWDSAESVTALINQLKLLKTEAVSRGTSVKSYLDILLELEGEFDALSDSMKSLAENGIVASDAIKDLLENYPGLEKYFSLTDQGYIQNANFDGWSITDILNDYVTNTLQTYVDIMNECEAGTDEFAAAQEELNNAIAVGATLLRSQAIEDATKAWEAQKAELDDQLDRYNNLVSIRKELLKTYQSEVDYQKALAAKQKAVTNLQTQLALVRMDTSAAGRARVRELEEELSSAQDELDDYTLEHAIDVLTAQIDSSASEYESFISSEIDRIEAAIENLAKSLKINFTISDDGIEVETTGGDEYGTYHSGGVVGNVSLKDNEEFAKLMKGEFVSTPAQMNKFMNQTLPLMTGGGVQYNAPLIKIDCKSITKEALPALRKIIEDASEEIKKEMDSVYSRTGYRRDSEKFST